MFLPSPCVLPREAEKPFGSMKPAGAERHVSAIRSLWLRVKVGAQIASAIGSQIGDFLLESQRDSMEARRILR